MTRTELIQYLHALDACDEALEWIDQTPGELADLWAACPCGDWMIWLLAAVGYDERTLRHLACDVAEDVLPIYERAYPDDPRPRNCIAVTRRYADGAATRRELIAAKGAAMAAAKAADWAEAKAAAYAAAYAAAGDASWAAANAAASDEIGAVSSAAAWDVATARHADMVRARVSWADVERVMERAAREERRDA